MIFLFSTILSGFTLDSLLTYSFEAKRYDPKKASEVYKKYKCALCHGEQGQLRVGTSKPLKDMKAADIKAALRAFSEKSFNKIIQHTMPSQDEIDLIIAHVKGADFAIKLKKEKLKKEEPKPKTPAGTFLE